MPTPVVVTGESGIGGSAVPTGDTRPIEVDDSGTLPTCTPERLDTRTAGELSVGAAAGVGAPWLSASGGLDRSVVTEVAATLGFAPDDVHWAQVPAPPGQAVADVDLAVGTFVIPDDPSNASADHSSGYLDLAQVVLVRRGSTAPATLDGVMTGTVAAVSGTPGFAAATGLGAQSVTAMPDVDAAAAALRSGTVDFVVVDLASAAPLVADASARILGRLPSGMEQPQQFGLVLSAGSPLTSCVSAAVDALRIEGRLDALAAGVFGPAAMVELR